MSQPPSPLPALQLMSRMTGRTTDPQGDTTCPNIIYNWVLFISFDFAVSTMAESLLMRKSTKKMRKRKKEKTK